MNNHQNHAGQSMQEMAEKRYKNRVWFTLLIIVGILLILFVAYNGKSLGLGGIGVVGLWVSARGIVNYSDVKTKQMSKEERRTIRGVKNEENAKGPKWIFEEK